VIKLAMETYIFPGYSEKNKIWVDTIANELSPNISSHAVYWQHWSSDIKKDGWIEEEANKFIAQTKEEKVNIIAKCAGTMVCMAIIKTKPQLINKIILCGLSIYDFLPGDEKRFEVLNDFPVDNILCIQNEHDNHGYFELAEKLINGINPKIKIVSKPREDHEYPYPEDYLAFLK
jgi:hypothetical protein